MRVDDHPEPVRELERLVGIHHLFFGTPRPENLLPVDETIARELQRMLVAQGYTQRDPDGTWDDESKRAFWQLVGNENLEERWNLDGNTDVIDRVALDYLRQRFG